jgi:hypothetical protein
VDDEKPISDKHSRILTTLLGIGLNALVVFALNGGFRGIALALSIRKMRMEVYIKNRL